MTELAAKPKRSIVTLIWLIVSQLIALATLLFWVVVAGLSVMAFDEGQSPVAWAIVIAAWAYPLFPLVMAIGAWIAFAFRKNRLAAILSGLTFTPAGLFYLVLRFGSLFGL
jgi:uncharacterized BrkB/YihY/UPF0761 family membrane protein